MVGRHFVIQSSCPPAVKQVIEWVCGAQRRSDDVQISSDYSSISSARHTTKISKFSIHGISLLFNEDYDLVVKEILLWTKSKKFDESATKALN